jgi:hypothetical protein
MRTALLALLLAGCASCHPTVDVDWSAVLNNPHSITSNTPIIGASCEM